MCNSANILQTNVRDCGSQEHRFLVKLPFTKDKVGDICRGKVESKERAIESVSGNPWNTKVMLKVSSVTNTYLEPELLLVSLSQMLHLNVLAFYN